MEVIGIILCVITCFIFMSLISYDPADMPFNTTEPNTIAVNYAGLTGAYIAFGLLSVFGVAAYILPFAFLVISLLYFFGANHFNFLKKLLQSAVLQICGSCLLSLRWSNAFQHYIESINITGAGGLCGDFLIQRFFLIYLGNTGSFIILGSAAFISLSCLTELTVSNIAAAAKQIGAWFVEIFRAGLRHMPKKDDRPWLKNTSAPTRVPPPPVFKREPAALSQSQPKKAIDSKAQSSDTVRQTHSPRKTGSEAYALPSTSLLSDPPPVKEREVMDDLTTNSRILEGTLRDFGIEATVVGATRGPVITRYELQPAPGVKVQRISALSDDIALALKALTVRILAPIPGKAAVGIEVPNSTATAVYLKELLCSEKYASTNAKIPLVLGKDIAGNPLIEDLAEMPHLLIAGSTGSGKTVCVNSIITGLLFFAAPEQIKFLMVDPKIVELTCYKNIPHLVTPVVTDPKKASGALAWAVREMERRYRLFEKAGARNIAQYNQKVSAAQLFDDEGKQLEVIPYIVIIIDELADLMMVAPAEVENSIARLTQLSRAAGIHSIIATQRPSVDVLTGVIKANLPARISFKVASKVDSRTILDANGADKLLGKGDLLFLQPGTSKLIRGQGAFVHDSEINQVTQFIIKQCAKDQEKQEFNADPVEEDLREQEENSFEDELFDDAMEVILLTGQASVSMIQRRLKIGYNRAARIMDLMEERGYVGPASGTSKARAILIEEYKGIRANSVN